MHNLAQAQTKAINDNNIEKLEEIIRARQQLIVDLETVNKDLQPLKEEIQKALGLEVFSSKVILQKVPTLGAEQLEQVLGQLTQVLEAIKGLDKENEKLLKDKLNQVKTDLKEVQSKKKVNNAYSSTGKTVSSNFFDEST